MLSERAGCMSESPPGQRPLGRGGRPGWRGRGREAPRLTSLPEVLPQHLTLTRAHKRFQQTFINPVSAPLQTLTEHLLYARWGAHCWPQGTQLRGAPRGQTGAPQKWGKTGRFQSWPQKSGTKRGRQDRRSPNRGQTRPFQEQRRRQQARRVLLAFRERDSGWGHEPPAVCRGGRPRGGSNLGESEPETSRPGAGV